MQPKGNFIELAAFQSPLPCLPFPHWSRHSTTPKSRAPSTWPGEQKVNQSLNTNCNKWHFSRSLTWSMCKNRCKHLLRFSKKKVLCGENTFSYFPSVKECGRKEIPRSFVLSRLSVVVGLFNNHFDLINFFSPCCSVGSLGQLDIVEKDTSLSPIGRLEFLGLPCYKPFPGKKWVCPRILSNIFQVSGVRRIGTLRV